MMSTLFDPTNQDSIYKFAQKLKGKTLRNVLNKSQVSEIEEIEKKAIDRAKKK